jgi:DNA-binding beta-propeller fold protein YncE
MRLLRMNFSQARVRLVQAGAVFAAAALVAGCGNNYRPVVTPTNPSGPAAQPESLAVVVTAPSPTTPGITTVIDYAGDSILAQAVIGPGPTAFTLDESGYNGYTINSDHTITNIPVSSTLQTKNVTFSTLPTMAMPLNLYSPSAGLWATDLCATIPPSSVCENAADVFTGGPVTLLLSVPLAPAPVMVMGPPINGKRYFAVNQNIISPTGLECNNAPTTQPLGDVTPIEIASYTTDTPIPTGRCPVYAVQSSDGARLFVLNRGSDTVTVINSQFGTLDNQCPPPAGCVNQSGQKYFTHPTLPLSQAALNSANAPPNCNFTSDATCSLPADGGLPLVAGPVYAEYNTAKNLLVVANYAGNTITVIDVSLDEYGNDSSTFGTTYTIPVGKNPASVTVLVDGSRAYTANQTDQTVTIANLSSYTVEKTLPVTGYPRTVVSTQNSTYGKVYVGSPNTNYLTIIRTDQDIVDTTILLEGDIVDVRVSTQDASKGNNNVTSRIPGYGQPCNLPPGVMATLYPSGYTLANCQKQP